MKPAFWFVPVVLLALGRQFSRREHPFTIDQLLSWAPELGKSGAARCACKTLARSGLLVRAPDAPLPDAGRRPSNPSTWRLTANGIQACRAAVQEAGKQARIATLKATNRKRIGSTLYGRLWNLLRNRKHLTAEEAVATLADAGDETQRLLRSASGYLSAWQLAFPEHIQVSARRVNGFKRYVVVQDPGPTPPPARRAAQEAAAQ